PPGGTNPAALSPVEADGCEANDPVLLPGLVVAEFVSVEPAAPGGVWTTMSTDFELLGPIVPNEHVTGPVPEQPGDADTNVDPAGRVSVTCTPGTGVSPVFVTVTVYFTFLPAVGG